MRPPASGVCTNPMRGLRAGDMQAVRIGSTLLELAPEAKGLLICRLNGEIVSRLTDAQRDTVKAIRDAGAPQAADLALRDHALRADNWAAIRVAPNDVIEWHDEPGGREGVRALLMVAAVALNYFLPGSGYALAASIAVIAYNVLLPPRQPPGPGEGPEGIFAASLAGNAARIDESIPKICGRVKFTPPWAMIPYQRFESRIGEDPDRNRDQYFHALYCVGIGNHEIEKALVGKTSLAHFSDVVVDAYLAPGEDPSRVVPNTFTSVEVSGSELDSKLVGDDEVFEARYVGGFAACRPGDRFSRFSVDVVADQGLGATTEGGESTTRTAEWQVEVREIDNYGRPVGEWQVVANESRTDDTNTPQRWTSDYELAAPIRGEVRLVRTDIKGTDANIRDSIQWTGLRVELERLAPLNEYAAHYEIVMRGGDQLNPYTSKDFSLIVRGLCRTWDPEYEWGPEIFTRNAAWWLADLLTSTTWGLGLPDERVDLQSIYEWSLVLDARQDRFDYAFASGMDGWEAAQLIARSGRARVFRRNGVVSVARDELVDLPVTAFTSRNTQPGSIAIETTLPNREQPDGVVAEFLWNVSWDKATVWCPAPGYRSPDDPDSDTDLPVMSRPVFQFYPGITGPIHAEREGLYDAANMTYRRTTATCSTEMEGATVAYLDPVRLVPQFPGYSQTGDVASWDPGTLVMGLSEPVDWSTGELWLVLRRDDGTLTDPVEVFPGLTANDVVLPDLPGFSLVLDDGMRERPMYVLGPATGGEEIVKVANIADGGRTAEGAQLFDLVFVVDDDRVHTADNSLLPGPGEIQDPIDDGSDYSDEGGGLVTLPRLTAREIVGGSPEFDLGGFAGVTLHADGTLSTDSSLAYVTSPTSTTIGGQWLSTSPVDPAVAALYEIFVNDFGSLVYQDAAGTEVDGLAELGAWLPMNVDRAYSIKVETTDPANDFSLLASNRVIVQVQIRRIGTTVSQVTRNLTLTVLRGPSVV